VVGLVTDLAADTVGHGIAALNVKIKVFKIIFRRKALRAFHRICGAKPRIYNVKINFKINVKGGALHATPLHQHHTALFYYAEHEGDLGLRAVFTD